MCRSPAVTASSSSPSSSSSASSAPCWPSRRTRVTLKIQSAHASTIRCFPPTSPALLGVHPTGGNSYAVLTNGDQIFPPMLAAVNGAKRRISFETYIYNEGIVGAAVHRRVHRGGEARRAGQLVVDAMGSNKIPKEWVEQLKAAGVKMGEFGQTKWYSLEELNYRTHRKILVVDGRVGFTGGVGLDDQWLGNAQDKEHWRDTHGPHRRPRRPADGGGVQRELRRDARSRDADRRSAGRRCRPSRSTPRWSCAARRPAAATI